MVLTKASIETSVGTVEIVQELLYQHATDHSARWRLTTHELPPHHVAAVAVRVESGDEAGTWFEEVTGF